MMELFKPDGHLTHEGLQALLDERLNELERLEAAEHMSFCDDCLTAYLAALDGTTLLESPAPMAQAVLRQGKRKGRAILLGRYAGVAAAAALATALWSTGVLASLTGAISGLTGSPQAPAGAAAPPTSQSAQAEADAENEGPRAPLGNRANAALGNVNNFLNNIFGGGTAAPTTQESAELTERERREALFGDSDTTGETDTAPSDGTQETKE